MTREEAINHLKTVAKSAIDSGYDGAVVDAVDMAIKAIEQQPCEDCISREAAEDVVMWYDGQGAMLNEIHKLPSVQPKPKTGHWIFDEILDKHYYCSECKSMGVDYWDYCPYCGAKMREVTE